MPLRPVAADGLPPTLLHFQKGNDSRPENEDEKQGGQNGPARPRGKIAEHVEGRNIICQAGEEVVEHKLIVPVHWRKTRSYGFNQRSHAAAQRPLDHDDVPGMKPVQKTVLQLRR